MYDIYYFYGRCSILTSENSEKSDLFFMIYYF